MSLSIKNRIQGIYMAIGIKKVRINSINVMFKWGKNDCGYELKKALGMIKRIWLDAEVLVADTVSTGDSISIAKKNVKDVCAVSIPFILITVFPCLWSFFFVGHSAHGWTCWLYSISTFAILQNALGLYKTDVCWRLDEMFL